MSVRPATKMYFDYLLGLAAIVTVLGFLINNWSVAGSLAFAIWQHLFVNIWFIWLGLGVYGAVRLVRFVKSFYLRFEKVEERLAALEAVVHKRMEEEAKSRIASDDALAIRFAGEIHALRDDTRAEFVQATQREAHQRANGIDAVQRDLERQFERMNRIETTLAKQVADLQDKFTHTEREPSPAELLASRPGNGMLNRAR